jgi:hypothetical protein
MDAHEVSALREEVTAVLAVLNLRIKWLFVWKARVVWYMAMAWLRPSYNVCAISRSR